MDKISAEKFAAAGGRKADESLADERRPLGRPHPRTFLGFHTDLLRPQSRRYLLEGTAEREDRFGISTSEILRFPKTCPRKALAGVFPGNGHDAMVAR
jgi:hypothetical protein